MIQRFKIAAVVVVFCFATYFAVADRGGFGRKNRVHFNITTLNTLKSSIVFNLKSGLNYKGNSILKQQQVGNSIFSSTIVSYQKGNTIYILPYKQKILMQSYSQASGSKLIIRSK